MHSDTRCFTVLLTLLLTATAGIGFAVEARPEAVLTEVRHGLGAVLVARPGQSTPRPAEPLMVVGAEDKVIVRGDARAVVLFPGGTTATVTQATSPLTVPAVDEEHGALEIRNTLSRLYGVLRGGPVPRMYVQLGTRAPGKPGAQSAALVRHLPDSVVLDWRARPGAVYEVTVSTDDGPRWTYTRAAPPLVYPAEAPPLVAGALYEFSVRSGRAIVDHNFFEVVSEADQTSVRAELAELDALPAPPATRALLRGSHLAAARLLPAARRELEAAVQAHPAEPSLRTMLASVYVSLGRSDLADRERRMARTLLRGR